MPSKAHRMDSLHAKIVHIAARWHAAHVQGCWQHHHMGGTSKRSCREAAIMDVRTWQLCPLQDLCALQSCHGGQGVRGAPVVGPQQAHAGARLIHLGQHAGHQVAQMRCLCLYKHSA